MKPNADPKRPALEGQGNDLDNHHPGTTSSKPAMHPASAAELAADLPGMMAPLLAHRPQKPQPTKAELREQGAAAVTAWTANKFKPPAGRKTNRTVEGGPSPLAEPIIIAEWKRGRSGDVVRVTLKNYEGYDIIDIRVWWSDGGYRKPGKGFAMGVRRLAQLAGAINKALARARELDLIPAEDKP